MRTSTQALLGILIAFPAASGAAKMPSSATYHFFRSGSPIGTNEITIDVKADTILFTSSVNILIQDYELALNSQTEADPETYRTLRFTYDGYERGKPVSGRFVSLKDSLDGAFSHDGTEYPCGAKLEESGFYVFHDFHLEHLILLASSFFAQDKYIADVNLFFSPFKSFKPTKISFESERELSAEDKSFSCKKLRIDIEGSPPLYSFVDPEIGLPIYILFPGTQVEAFLESHFGEHPTSFYRVREIDEEDQEE